MAAGLMGGERCLRLRRSRRKKNGRIQEEHAKQETLLRSDFYVGPGNTYVGTRAAPQTETVLHSFDSADNGAYVPALSVVFDPAGNLYGTTHFGGFNYGGAVYVAPSQVRAALTSTHG
jgi:hypothetical protein